jgi:superfamily II DNA/RNA helicase
MHRVGRTGRFGKDGLSLSLTSNTDVVYDHILDQIEGYYKIKIKPLRNLDEIAKLF